jgi:hypothetical protein
MRKWKKFQFGPLGLIVAISRNFSAELGEKLKKIGIIQCFGSHPVNRGT